MNARCKAQLRRIRVVGHQHLSSWKRKNSSSQRTRERARDMATVYSSSALHKKEKSPFSSLPFALGGGSEKHLTQPGGRRWTTPVLIPTPAFVRRPITIHVPLPPSVYRSLLARKYGQLVALVALGILIILALTRRRHPHYENSSQAPTLVFGRQDLRRIWQWEIAAGHYPSTRRSMHSRRVI